MSRKDCILYQVTEIFSAEVTKRSPLNTATEGCILFHGRGDRCPAKSEESAIQIRPGETARLQYLGFWRPVRAFRDNITLRLVGQLALGVKDGR